MTVVIELIIVRFMNVERPTEFSGPGVVVMRRPENVFHFKF